jgi:peptidoglycan/xylan/chitin deacetylase (PgdA/CDA1 family)
VVVSHGGRDQQVVALTIDDGNDAAVCRQEFDYLRANAVPATFFPTLDGVSTDPDLWREIAAAGYPIGNHTRTHADLTAPGMDDAAIRKELVSARKGIEAITGRPMIPALRPTFGRSDDQVLRIAGEIGLHTAVLWSVTSADTALHSKAAGMIRDALSGGPGDVILMHCNAPISAQILPDIVQGYLAKGYAFVTIPQLLRSTGAGGAPGSTPGPAASPGE